MTEIEKYKPCIEAIKYRKKFKTFKEAWDNCPRGDWMLWIAAKLEVNHRQLTLAKAYCTETVIHLMKDERSIQAVKVAKRYGRNRATKGQLKDAADAAADAYDVYADAAAYAAYDAAYAACAADAYAAYDAAYAACAACAADAYAAYDACAADAADAYAACAADAADAKRDNQKLTADICRKYLTEHVMKKI